MQTDQTKPQWRGPLGWALLVLGVIERVVGWGGSIDFVLSRKEDPAWLGQVFAFFVTNIGLALILVGVAFIVWNERRRVDAILHGRILPPTTEAAPAKEPKAPTGGDFFQATATVRDPTPEQLLQRGLYVGQILIGADELKKNHLIQLTIRGFNGSNRIGAVADVTGHILAEVPAPKGDKKQQHQLPTPTIVRNPDDKMRKFEEFHIGLQQHVTPGQARAILKALESGTVPFDLDGLNITVTPLGEAAPRVRLPLWNGATLRPAGGFQTGRMIKAVGRATAKAQAVIGEPQSPEGTGA